MVIPVHYATFPILAGTPTELAEATDAEVVALEPGETWETSPLPGRCGWRMVTQRRQAAAWNQRSVVTPATLSNIQT